MLLCCIEYAVPFWASGVSEELEKLGGEENFKKRLWPVHFVRVGDGGVEMREESNRVSCSSRDKNEQERWWWWLLFCGPESYKYVVVTGTRELWDLLAEGDRGSKTKPRLRANEQGRIGWAGRRESEGEWIFDNCWGRPMSMNSVLDGLKVRRLAVIQEEIVGTEDWSWLMTNGKSLGTNEVKRWVSSA